jgi:hypothetical protein
MYPDKFQEGIHRFIECKSLHPVFNFVCQYVRQLHLDQWITKTLKNCPGASFFQIRTPSNISYVISLVKNGQEMWDQEMGIAGNQEKGDDEPKKKAWPLFTSGTGKKHLFGLSLWNKAGLEYYYTTEENWKVVYNSKEMFSRLCNDWERWEPKDNGNRKQALKTWWKKVNVVTKLKNDENGDDETWYEKGGFTADLGVTGEWEHDTDIGKKTMMMMTMRKRKGWGRWKLGERTVVAMVVAEMKTDQRM